VNLGLRTESEYIPAMTTDETIPGYTPKPINFGFGEKLAPRLGAIYDVFGDSSLKIFASYGVYYDVMKLYMAEGAYGGFKWQQSYYDLDNYDWPAIAASGDRENQAEQALGGDYAGSIDWRHRSFGEETDPNMLPISQSEFSFGLEKRLSEELSFSARGVYKHLITTIEDIGYLLDGSEAYVIGNPGLAPPSGRPKAVCSTRITGNAPRPRESTTASTWPWKSGSAITGRAASTTPGARPRATTAACTPPTRPGGRDRTSTVTSTCGSSATTSTAIPSTGSCPPTGPLLQGLRLLLLPVRSDGRIVAYGRSGLPRTTMFSFDSVTSVANGYGDLGRTPFLFTTDIYVEYNIKLAAGTTSTSTPPSTMPPIPVPLRATRTTPTRTPGGSTTTSS